MKTRKRISTNELQTGTERRERKERGTPKSKHPKRTPQTKRKEKTGPTKKGRSHAEKAENCTLGFRTTAHPRSDRKSPMEILMERRSRPQLQQSPEYALVKGISRQEEVRKRQKDLKRSRRRISTRKVRLKRRRCPCETTIMKKY